MSIFKNLKEAVSANVNNEIETRVRPDVMARYYADKAQEELNKAGDRAAAFRADRMALERDIEQAKADVEELSRYAETAMQAGNKEDAKRFVQAKVSAQAKLAADEKALAATKEMENAVIEAYDAQAKEVAAMESDMREICANVTVAASKEAAAPYSTSLSNRATRMFRKMKERSRRMVDEADAKNAIVQNASPTAIEDLKAKYDAPSDPVATEMALLEQKYS